MAAIDLSWELVGYVASTGGAIWACGRAWQRIQGHFGDICERLAKVEERQEKSQKAEVDVDALEIASARHEAMCHTNERHRHLMDRRLTVVETILKLKRPGDSE